jgi:hypothetical protein
MPWRATSVGICLEHLSQAREGGLLVVAAQVEVESKIEAKFDTSFTYCSFNGLDPGAFNVGLIG